MFQFIGGWTLVGATVYLLLILFCCSGIQPFCHSFPTPNNLLPLPLFLHSEFYGSPFRCFHLGRHWTVLYSLPFNLPVTCCRLGLPFTLCSDSCCSLPCLNRWWLFCLHLPGDVIQTFLPLFLLLTELVDISCIFLYSAVLGRVVVVCHVSDLQRATVWTTVR